LKEAALSRDIETAMLRYHINAGVEHARSVGTLRNWV
jgi:hypothetical protein